MTIQKQIWTILSDELNIESKIITLKDQEHHYAFNVLRLKIEDTVEVTNCRGLKATGVIASINKKELKINILTINNQHKVLPEIHLWLAMPKLSTAEDVISMSSEMGVSQIHIFKSEKSFTKAPLKIEKAIQLSREATRISKSAFASEIYYYASMNEFYEKNESQKNSKQLILFCDESHIYEGKIQNSILKIMQKNFIPETKEICILVGPESSFSDKEREFILNNIPSLPVSLGPNLLKVPHAVASALGTVISFRNDLN